jgi:hypothetical protein
MNYLASSIRAVRRVPPESLNSILEKPWAFALAIPHKTSVSKKEMVS